jgi:PAS domain S-box-containing protein
MQDCEKTTDQLIAELEAARRRIADLEVGGVEHTQTEKALRDSEQRYHRFFKNATIGFFRSTPHGRIIEVNAAYARMFGYDSPEQLQAMVTSVPNQLYVSKQNHYVNVHSILYDKMPFVIENEYKRKDGKHFIGILHSWPTKNGDGDVIEGFVEDITERKQAEDALHQSETIFRHIFDQAPIGAAIINLDFKYRMVNDELCRITGYAKHELISKCVKDITHPDDHEETLESIRLLDNGVIDQYVTDKRYVRKHGITIWVHLSLRLIRDNEDRPEFYLAMIVDINGQKLLSEELRRKNKIVEKKVCELGEMNIALRVMLDQRERDKQVIQDQVLTNMRLLVAPYLEKIQREVTQSSVESYLAIIKRNIAEITSSFSRTLNTEYRSLTANEIRVADLIRAGLTSKEIAAIMSISPRTVEYYRGSIRKKLRLSGKTTNLGVHLNMLAN